MRRRRTTCRPTRNPIETVPFDLIASIANDILELHRQIHGAVASQLKQLAGGDGSVILACGTAFGLGMVHALTPGHGKAILFAYFLGRKARPWAGVAAAAQVAGLHVGTATVLVVAIGAASYAWGRPTGVAFALQSLSAVAVTAMGAWYLWRSFRKRDSTAASQAHGHSKLALAVGLLPCPLTMLVLSAAFSYASLGIGLLLVAVMGLGILATIGAVGSIGIGLQRLIAANVAPAGSRYVMTLRLLEVASAMIIIVMGISAVAAIG
jgi:nickel/cobalt transporter (NicO) family protein